MSAFYATNKEVKILSDKLDLLNTKLDLLNTKLDSDAEGNLKVRLSGTNVEVPLKYSDTSITIQPGPSNRYITDRIHAGASNYFRFQLNFNQEISEEDIKIYYNGALKDDTFEGAATSSFFELPFKVYRATRANTSLRVAISDGDIPIFTPDFRMLIENNTAEDIVLRQVVIKKLM